MIRAKDPGSAITHFIGMLCAIISAIPLLTKAPDTLHFLSLGIFIGSMILLYAASTTYHTFDISEKDAYLSIAATSIRGVKISETSISSNSIEERMSFDSFSSISPPECASLT